MPGKVKEFLKGRCTFHSETGTEGGYWSFQDGKFITQNTTRFSCSKCHRYWDKAQYPDGLPDSKDRKEALVVERVMPMTEEMLREDWKPSQTCPPGECTFEPTSKEDWSYEGLHILKNGDRLTIYSPDNSQGVVWSGTIKLKRYPVFTEHAFGMWIHADQEEVEREVWAEWFMEGYPAEFVEA
ncbi:MAG: hypothetical protein AAB617_01755 [Patescibacteria group bacterium]